MSFISQYNITPFQRTTTSFVKDGSSLTIASGSTQNMGGAFIILNAQLSGNAPVRLRLYSDQSSRDIDADRPTGNFNLSQSVALVADIVLTNNGLLTFDPPIIGNTYSNGNVWYHLSGSTATQTITLTSYQIGLSNDSNDGRRTISVSGSSVPTTGYGISGSVSSPKSFLILSGSSTAKSRLRLYSRPYTEIPIGEQTRAFGTEPVDGSLLIADLVFDSASFHYPLVPILESFTWTNTNYAVGNEEIGYILENQSGGVTNITSSLYIYSTED